MSHVKKCPFVLLGVSLVVLAGGERLIQRSVCPCSAVTVVSSGWRAGTRWLCTWKTFRPCLSLLFSVPFPVLLVPIGMERSSAAPAPGFCEGTAVSSLPNGVFFPGVIDSNPELVFLADNGQFGACRRGVRTGIYPTRVVWCV